MAQRTYESPVGPVTVQVIEGVVSRVIFGRDGTSEPAGSDRDAAVADEAIAQLEAYFAGSRHTFDLPLAQASTPFAARVRAELCALPWGATATYADLAGAVGNPKAYRAVATACARNPLPLIVPCHRILRSNGTIGGYLGGVEAKRWLLAHEQA